MPFWNKARVDAGVLETLEIRIAVELVKRYPYIGCI